MLVLTYSYRIYPDLEQELQMLHWLETCRKVYNYAVGERKDWINSRKCPVNVCRLQKEYIIPADTPYPDYYRQKKALTEAKKTNPDLKAVHSQVLQDVIGRVDAAFVAFHQKRTGFPRFKKFGRMRSFLFPQMKGEAMDGNSLKRPKIGQVLIHLHRPIPEGFDLKAVRVVRKHSGWYVMLTLKADVDVPDIPPEGHALGLDVGLEYFLSTSDGEQVSRPRFFNKLHRKLKSLQRRLKGKQKGSKNWLKLIKRIGQVHETIANYRLDWQFKLAHHLCDQAGMIVVEDLDFRTLAKGFLGKPRVDAGLGQFVTIVLPWVCWKRGVYYGKVNPRGTSQECPDCGADVHKALKDRIHRCGECGSIKPRDVASAQVIRNRGLSAVGLTTDQGISGRDLPGALPRQDRMKEIVAGAIQ